MEHIKKSYKPKVDKYEKLSQYYIKFKENEIKNHKPNSNLHFVKK